MEKIPVGTTIARAYNFAFGRFFILLGIMWLPFAIMMVAWLPFMRQMTAFSTALSTHNFAAMGPTVLVIVLFYILSLLLILMQMVGLTQEVLGLRKGSRFFYFNLGQPLWVLVLSMILLMLAFVVLIIAIALAVGAAAGLARVIGGAGGAAAAVIMSFALYCLFIYVTTRLSFLAIPVAVAENRIGLKRAWQLGKGNFWRMFVIMLAVVLPIFVLMATLMFTLLLQGMPLPPPTGASPEQLAQYQQATSAWQSATMNRELGYWYITFPLLLLFSVLFYGIIAGAQSFAYRALVPHDPAEEFS